MHPLWVPSVRGPLLKCDEIPLRGWERYRLPGTIIITRLKTGIKGGEGEGQGQGQGEKKGGKIAYGK
jgi:hypothetical protein